MLRLIRLEVPFLFATEVSSLKDEFNIDVIVPSKSNL